MAVMSDVDARALIDKIYAADGAMDAEAFVALLSCDVTFRMGSAPALQGREAVHDAVRQLFSTLRGVRHRLIAHWVGEGKLAFEGEVTFTLPDGRTVTLPYVDVVTQAEDGLLSDYRIYIDVTPLLQ